MRRDRLDLAETLAAASVCRWEGGSLLSRTQSGILLATIYVKAGEPDGLHWLRERRDRSVRAEFGLIPGLLQTEAYARAAHIDCHHMPPTA